ncbi:multidrug effflux MFS transporter [Falsihalocynthiibacter sp. SS001]|uniref:multidrug effflux MFS transporter n=1 Tax=Falsihalocynthiibacter sp. SS001 TaxID=3349698 RepID=UPI0036D32187
MAQKRLSLPEFVSLIAMMFALIALSIDAMLPGIPAITSELSPEAPNRVMLVVLVFVFGMGIGTFFTGALADAFGRKTVILLGMGIYLIGAIIAYLSTSLEILLAARLLQGIGASGPRIAALAMVRDLFEGPQMARVMSIAMTIFMIVPAIAPLLGQAVIFVFGWRAIFAMFAIFALVAGSWLFFRQAETLTPDNVRPISIKSYFSALLELSRNRIVVISMLVQTAVITFLFATISSIQPIFDETYGMASSFPYWFAGIAVVAATSNVINARLVVRLGMRKLIKRALSAHVVIVGIILVTGLITPLPFWMYLLLVTANFLLVGFCMGNLTALALEPMGHIAGMASSITAGISTVLGVVIAVPITQNFDGTPMPLVIGAFTCSVCAISLMVYLGPRRMDKQ